MANERGQSVPSPGVWLVLGGVGVCIAVPLLFFLTLPYRLDRERLARDLAQTVALYIEVMEEQPAGWEDLVSVGLLPDASPRYTTRGSEDGPPVSIDALPYTFSISQEGSPDPAYLYVYVRAQNSSVARARWVATKRRDPDQGAIEDLQMKWGLEPDAERILAAKQPRWVILELDDDGDVPFFACQPYWTPSQEQARALLERLPSLLKANSSQPRVREVIRQFEDYRLQLLGGHFEGERIIFVNGFCSEHWFNNGYWREHPVVVLDGGSCYFGLYYAVDSSKVVQLWVNGEA